jgi:hypothetical protein
MNFIGQDMVGKMSGEVHDPVIRHGTGNNNFHKSEPYQEAKIFVRTVGNIGNINFPVNDILPER